MLRHLCQLADATQRHLYLEARRRAPRVAGGAPCSACRALASLRAVQHDMLLQQRPAQPQEGLAAAPALHPPAHACAPPPPPLPLPQASTERSQALYARHGFAHIADKPLGEAGEEGAPVLRVMVRPPSGPTLAAAADGAARA